MSKIEKLWVTHWLLLIATFLGFVLSEKLWYGLAFFISMGINDIILNIEIEKLETE